MTAVQKEDRRADEKIWDITKRLGNETQKKKEKKTMVIYKYIYIYICISRKASHPQRWHLCNMAVFMHRPEYMAHTDEIQTYHF